MLRIVKRCNLVCGAILLELVICSLLCILAIGGFMKATQGLFKILNVNLELFDQKIANNRFDLNQASCTSAVIDSKIKITCHNPETDVMPNSSIILMDY